MGVDSFDGRIMGIKKFWYTIISGGIEPSNGI